jgi:peptidoglycan/LPS O-acetylase OafA/YrhL
MEIVDASNTIVSQSTSTVSDPASIPGSTQPPSDRSRSGARGFRPDVEGLRAVAILLVVAFHGGVPWLRGGYIGVDVFFVLSGYLITGLLLKEAVETGRVNLIQFYSRRARRLLPAAICVLVVTSVLSILVYAPFEQTQFVAATASAAAYVSNIYFAHKAGNYHGLQAQRYPSLHMWSLGVEEQFYAFWPLFVVLGLGVYRAAPLLIRKRRLVAWMLAAGSLSLALSLYITNVRQPWAFFSLPTRVWEFAIGGLGALLPAGSLARRMGVSRGALILVRSTSWLGIGGILFAAVTFTERTSFPGTAAMIPALSTVAVLCALAINPAFRVGRVLSVPPMQLIGRLSYSWYLWHWPLLVIGGVALGGLTTATRSGLLLVSLLLAYVSYKWVESPIRSQRRLRFTPGRSLAAAALLTSMSLAGSLLWRETSLVAARSPAQAAYAMARELPRMYAMHCDAQLHETALRECEFGSTRAPRTVVLIGDSHAGQWFPAAEKAFQGPEWRLTVLTKSGCAMPLVSYYLWHVKRNYLECELWRIHALERIHDLRPALVIVGSSYNYSITPAQWKDGTEKLLSRLSTSAGRVVLLRDNPRPAVDIPVCLARVAWNPILYARRGCIAATTDTHVEIFNAQREAASRFGNTVVVDLNDRICGKEGCEFRPGGTVVFRDTDHLTVAFARTLAPYLSAVANRD